MECAKEKDSKQLIDSKSDCRNVESSIRSNPVDEIRPSSRDLSIIETS